MIRLLALFLLRLLVRRMFAAYGTPTDPVSATVITVAYAVANLLNPIRWLRQMTGNADPPGTGYVVTSDSTTATSWKTGTTAILAVLGYTPVNKAGDTMSGALLLANNVAYRVAEASGFARDVLKMTTTDAIEFGNANNLMDFLSAQLTIRNAVYIALKEASGFVRTVLRMNPSDVIEFGNINNILNLITAEARVNNSRVLTNADEGSGNGIDADTVDGAERTFLLARSNHTGTQAAATISDLATAILARSQHTGTQLAATISNFAATVATLPAASATTATTATTANAIADGAVSAAAKIAAGIVNDTHVAAANKDGVAGTASLRTLGTGAAQAAAGNHAHSNPTGMAKIASGTYAGTNSGSKVVTGVGFTPKILYVQKTTVSSLAGILTSHDMVTFLPPNANFGVAAGTLDADGFTLTIGSGFNASANYAWVAIG